MPPITVAVISKIRLKRRLRRWARLFFTSKIKVCSFIKPRAWMLAAGIPNNSGTKVTFSTRICSLLIKVTNLWDSKPGAQTRTFGILYFLITASASLNLPRHSYLLANTEDLGLSSTKPTILYIASGMLLKWTSTSSAVLPAPTSNTGIAKMFNLISVRAKI